MDNKEERKMHFMMAGFFFLAMVGTAMFTVWQNGKEQASQEPSPTPVATIEASVEP